MSRSTVMILLFLLLGLSLPAAVWCIDRPNLFLLVAMGICVPVAAFWLGWVFAQKSAALRTMSARIEQIETKYKLEVASKEMLLEQLRHADRLKTVGQLTSGVLHELGTPLTIAGGRARMIEEGEVEGLEAKENARIVVEQTNRIASMISSILDFARRGRRGDTLCDLNQVVSDGIRLLAPVALKQGVTLKWQPAAEPMFIRIEVSQVQQVMANLIINAIQASESSSEVRVGIRQEQCVNPSHPHEPKETCVALFVEDRGEGISPDRMGHIFDSFYTTKTPGAGTGLGLVISRQIARENGGWIHVDSEEGKGSTFTLYLPQAKENR